MRPKIPGSKISRPKISDPPFYSDVPSLALQSIEPCKMTCKYQLEVTILYWYELEGHCKCWLCLLLHTIYDIITNKHMQLVFEVDANCLVNA